LKFILNYLKNQQLIEYFQLKISFKLAEEFAIKIKTKYLMYPIYKTFEEILILEHTIHII